MSFGFLIPPPSSSLYHSQQVRDGVLRRIPLIINIKEMRAKGTKKKRNSIRLQIEKRKIKT